MSTLAQPLNPLQSPLPTDRPPESAEDRQTIDEALARDPQAVYRLAGEAARLKAELAQLRHEHERLKRMLPMGRAPSVPSEDELRRQSEAWALLLGTGPGQPGRARTPRGPSLEDRGARFLEQHAGKVWLGLGLLTAAVVAIREGWI